MIFCHTPPEQRLNACQAHAAAVQTKDSTRASRQRLMHTVPCTAWVLPDPGLGLFPAFSPIDSPLRPPHAFTSSLRMNSRGKTAKIFSTRSPYAAPPSPAMSRRMLALSLLPFLSAIVPAPAHSMGLADRMRTRKADDLSKPMLPSFVAIPTQDQVYPEWLEGEWDLDGQFSGFELPVKEISKKQLMADKEIPGFQKLSVLTLPDMAAPLKHQLRFVRGEDGKVRQDREFNLASVVNGGLGKSAVKKVTCRGDRCTVDFVQGSTRNAERVELLYVGREAEEPKGGPEGLFVAAEFVRQVTLGLSTQFGVAREVIGEYQTFSTWVPATAPSSGPPTKARLNLLTAAYLQPQDNLFFQATSKPVVVYANDFVMTRK